MSNKTILRLIYGGKSAEHDVSLQTALSVIQALDMTKYEVIPMYISLQGKWYQGPKLTEACYDVEQLIFENEANGEGIFPSQFFATISESDVVFPLLHGPNGEDGTVQGLLELLNIAYVGNEVAASAIGMDKVFMKQVFAQHRLKQPTYLYFMKNDWSKNREEIYVQIENTLGFPCFVKPANLGSSVGISKCHSHAELERGIALAFQYDRKVIVEEAIVGREIEIAVLGNDEPQCSIAGEIVPDKDFYDYYAKYEDDKTSLIIPAEIPEHVYEEMKAMAIQAFQAIDGSGLVRADFFVTDNYEVFINEINTMPGFTPFSMFPLLWEHSGVTYAQLIERLVTLAIERYQEKQEIKYTLK